MFYGKKKLLEAPVYRSSLLQGWGLRLRKPKPLLFDLGRPRMLILDMFLVFWPIDVLFIDDKGFIVDKKDSFRPFTFYASRKKAKYVLELPAGMLSNLNKGDYLRIKFV